MRPSKAELREGEFQNRDSPQIPGFPVVFRCWRARFIISTSQRNCNLVQASVPECHPGEKNDVTPGSDFPETPGNQYSPVVRLGPFWAAWFFVLSLSSTSHAAGSRGVLPQHCCRARLAAKSGFTDKDRGAWSGCRHKVPCR